MKSLTTFIILCICFLGYASPKSRDTVYTNVEALMKKVSTTKKKTATFYLALKDGDDKDIKVRIDLKQIDCEIPLYKSEAFDIGKLMALKEESLKEPRQKLEALDVKAREWVRLTSEVKALTKERNALKADTLSIDSTAIATTEKKLKDKKIEFGKVDAEVTNLYGEYEALMEDLLGNLRSQYKQRLVAAMEEAYDKIENKQTTFKSVDDDATFWDIRLDLLKIDATRKMQIPRRVDGGGETTENITAGKMFYLLHFAEFGAWYEEEEVSKVFSSIKLTEFHKNPYLVDKQFGLVCDNQDRTQHYINSIVDYKNYSGSIEEVDLVKNSPLKIMKLRKESYGNYQEHVGKYGCVRTKKGRSCSHPVPTYMFAGKNKPHMGIDLLASEGTEVFSSVDGIAFLYPGEISGYGKVVSIKGKLMNRSTKKEEEVFILYAHLQEVLVKDGDTVEVGDVIGYSGRTGNARGMPQTEEHLHLEILTQKWPSSSKGFSVRKPPLNYFAVINP